MKHYPHNGQVYRLANGLSPFQLDMQIHLTDWKWNCLKTRECGSYKGQPYDVILPVRLKDEWQPIYRLCGTGRPGTRSCTVSAPAMGRPDRHEHAGASSLYPAPVPNAP